MTKFARLRVDVPVDDGLTVIQVRDHLQGVLEERATETLELKPGEPKPPNGEAEDALPVDLPRKGRVHWPAVSVVLAVERPPPQSPKPAKRGARAA